MTVSCLCGETSARLIRGPFAWKTRAGSYAIVQCLGCGLARTDPTPFADDRTAEVHQALAYEDVLARERTWRRFFDPIFRAARRHAPTGSFLDVGCGPGLCVAMATERGYDAFGVEINERSSTFAREQLGRRVITGDLASAAFPPQSFDVVLLSQVLEHLAHPRDVFEEIHRVIRPSGVLIVEVPNMAGLQVPLLGASWQGYAPDMHVWQFTPSSLAGAVGRLGFRVVEISARQNMEMGWPAHPLKKLVRATVFAAIEFTASVTNRADKMLCVASPQPPLKR